MKRITLVNPNTTGAMTELMVAIAREHLAPGLELKGVTAASGSPLIVDGDQLQSAAGVIASMAQSFAKEADGVIVCAFGDPGVEALRKQLSVPVAGIAESAMREAASSGRPFAIVTTTPGLVPHIILCAQRLGLGSQLAAVRVTEGPPEKLMADREQLVNALERAARLASEENAAEVIVVGGGPLAVAARVLRSRLSVPIVEPIPAAMRWMTSILSQ